MNLPVLVDPRLGELRRAFDAGFARPPPPPPEALEHLLLVAAGAGRYALRLGELSGLQPLHRLVPLPGARPELLGLAGVRGRLVAVFSLARLLGLDAAADEHPRWLAICGGEEPQLALAFAQFEGQRQLPLSELRPAEAGEAGSWARELASLGGQLYPVLQLPLLVRSLTTGADAPRPPE